MVMDRNGNVILAGAPARRRRPARHPAAAPTARPDPTFGANGTLDGAVLGLSRPRHRPAGAARRARSTFTVGGGPDQATRRRSPSSALLPTGAPDPTFGGTGVVTIPLGPGTAPGDRRAADPPGPVGHDARRRHRPDRRRHAARRGHPRCAPDGTLDTRFGSHGIARISRAGREIRIKAMVRDSTGRILLAGSGQPPDALVAAPARQRRAATPRFGNGGLTYPLLGRPPGGDPIYTTLRRDRRRGLARRARRLGRRPGPLRPRRRGRHDLHRPLRAHRLDELLPEQDGRRAICYRYRAIDSRSDHAHTPRSFSSASLRCQSLTRSTARTSSRPTLRERILDHAALARLRRPRPAHARAAPRPRRGDRADQLHALSPTRSTTLPLRR